MRSPWSRFRHGGPTCRHAADRGSCTSSRQRSAGERRSSPGPWSTSSEASKAGTAWSVFSTGRTASASTGPWLCRAVWPPPGGLHPPAVARLARALRDLRPDLVLAHGGDAFKYLALTTHAPIAYCVIGTWPVAARGSAQSLLWRALIRRAWVCAAVSDDVAADLHDVLAVAHERIVVIPNGRERGALPTVAECTQGRCCFAPLRGRAHRG